MTARHEGTGPYPQPRQPLEDIRILALEQYGAGPWGSLQLADLGAEVIKVEDPTVGGDVGRYVPPFQEGEDSLFFESLNRGKKSISLDLRTASGRRLFHDLVAQVDAVYSNMRGDQPAKLGLRYEDLKAVNPRIVCCSLSGYGTSGPRAAAGAYDYVIQGLAGWMSLTGDPDAPPTKTGLSLVDWCGGYTAALALMGGLWKARRDGVGCDCDISLFETAVALLNYVATWTATTGYEPERLAESAHPSIVPFQNIEAADGWLVVACPKEKFWRGLCAAIGEPDLADDERFASFVSRQANRAELVAHLREVFRLRTMREWIDALAAEQVPCAPINDLPTAFEDEQLVARGGLVEVEHPRFGTVRHVRSALRVDSASPVQARAPFRGEHTHELLQALCGHDEAAVNAAAAQGAFGSPSGPA